MMDYELVVGLEVHVELKTATKIFCGCRTDFDAPANTQCCPVCLGLPGALPVLNERVVALAVRAGLATNCRVRHTSVLARKHYFYPDSPKAYQISQYDQPLCEGGWLDIDAGDGTKRIGITRIHIEEDAGKLLHDDAGATRIDLNRCGVPLIELVTEPDFRAAAEVRAFLHKLRQILLAAGVSDCRMNEGQMRCDVNLSVRRPGEPLGTRTEMKNLNSIAYAGRAIEAEFARQAALAGADKPIRQETRRFDVKSGKTIAMRSKENADDYRYFPDPDLPPITLSPAWVEAMRASLPELPDARRDRIVRTWGLSPREAEQLCAQPRLADAFERAAPDAREPSRLWSLLMGEAARQSGDGDSLPVPPEHLAALSNLVTEGLIHTGAARQVLGEMLHGDARSPAQLVDALGLALLAGEDALGEAIEIVIAENADLVRVYLGGKENAFQALMGRVMAQTKGRADPARAAVLLRAKLSEKGG